MKIKIYLIAIASIIAISLIILSCGEDTKEDTTEVKEETKEVKDSVTEVVSFDSESFDEYEEETPPKDRIYLEDENDYYKAFIKYEHHDSVTVSFVYLVDKKNGSVIHVTGPFYNDDENYLGTEHPSDVKLISKKKHPWQVALRCDVGQHYFSTYIISENDTSHIRLDNQEYLGRSEYEDVFFFSEQQEDYGYSIRFSSGLVIYNADFKELRRKNIRIDYSKCSSKIKKVAKPLGKNGVKVDFSSIKDTIRSYEIAWGFDDYKYREAVVYDTKGDNGDIVSYVVLKPGNVTYKMPSNDGFVNKVIEQGILFKSYGTYPNGKRYTILQVFDDDMRMVHEVNASLH